MHSHKKVDDFITKILVDVQDILTNKYIFQEVKKLFFEERTPGVGAESDFFKWCWKNYVCSISIELRRLLDRRKSTISLIKLLEIFKNKPSLLSRGRYISYFQHANPKIANLKYDEYVGKNRNNIDPKVIKGEIKLLLVKSKNLRDYINNRIAHTYNQKIDRVPTWDEIHECVDLIKRKAEKYWNLWDGDYKLVVNPTYNCYWKDIFTVPWIQKKIQE